MDFNPGDHVIVVDGPGAFIDEYRGVEYIMTSGRRGYQLNDPLREGIFNKNWKLDLVTNQFEDDVSDV